MLTNYQNLSEEAKVYLYPSSRKFYPNELEELENKIKDFVSNWTDYSSSYRIEYNRFLLFFLEENAVITTSLLDKLANFIFQLEKDYSITLLDKVNVCFKQGEYVQYQDMKRFRGMIKNKSVSKKTIVFNNLIQTKHEFENEWEVLITSSWLSHLIKK
jgi:hypothetical protein